MIELSQKKCYAINIKLSKMYLLHKNQIKKFPLPKEYINVPIFIGSFLVIKRGILC